MIWIKARSQPIAHCPLLSQREEDRIMTNPLMQAPVLLFIGMVASFMLVLVPTAIADALRR